MIAGTLLVVAGFVGVLVGGKKAKEVESPSDEPTDASHQQMPPSKPSRLQAQEQRPVRPDARRFGVKAASSTKPYSSRAG
jgi:hypothetical protein